MDNRPRGRQQNITGQGKSVGRRGEGLGTGPMGNKEGYAGRGGSSSGGSGKRAGGGNPLFLIIAAIVVFLGGGGGLATLLGGGGSDTTVPTTPQVTQQSTQSAGQTSGGQISNGQSSLGSLLSGFTGSNVSTGWSEAQNTESLDTSVDSGARAKRTKIKGNGQDTVTIMLYMCGADLESKSGMGTSDISEMVNADLSDKVNLIIYTGGATKWKNSVVSSSTNQIYKVEKGGLRRLEADLGSVCMTKSGTLAGFIQYCAKNYPADRNDLILWDHGGGSVSGYGYDEKFRSAGSMSLKGIGEALKAGGVTFDFVGFDACLMATVENGLTLAPYADYLVASEETEPGVGWYYTNWLSRLSANTSMPTIEIGKNIADDFVTVCAKNCAGQKTTLSVVDLAELEATVPEKLNRFASATMELLQNDNYQVVSDARSKAREFSPSSKIDQVDLVSLAAGLDNEESDALIKVLKSAVKYNRTSSNMTNAYGLSIYFPYQKASKVGNAVSAYQAIGMDDTYTKCIQKFASLEVGGQAASGGSQNPVTSIFGSGTTQTTGSDAVTILLQQLLSGRSLGVEDLDSQDRAFLSESMDTEADALYLSEHQFDASALVWSGSAENPVLTMSESQWSLVHDLELNVLLDDGEGYIDLGLDNVFEFTEAGDLVGTYSGTWLAVNEQPVAYYHMDTLDDGDHYTITGRIPALLNGDRVNLMVVFTDEEPYGKIAGVQPVYASEVTETVAKNMTELKDGDVIDFICDYYDYDGNYQDSYLFGDPITVEGELMISDVYIDAAAANACYRFTDIYNQKYWTPIMK